MSCTANARATPSITAVTAAALRLLGGDLGGGYFAGVEPQLRWSGAAALLYGSLGVAAALAGGWWPARSAQALPPAQTLKGLGVQPGESLVDVLLAGRTPPEDSLAGWQAVVSQIQYRACNILKGVAQARKQEENKRAQAHRDALDMSPKLDQLNRQEAMIRRNIERTLKQLRGVRHELFA